jgi:hypothetical protein
MEVASRIHIIPLGYERDRILEPPLETNADRVVLLEYDGKDAQNPEYHSEVKERLRAEGIEVKIRNCNIFGLYESLSVIAEIATDYSNDDVYVNLATGSKVTAVAGMIACMVTGATPYYVRAEQYGEDEGVPETPVSQGVTGIEELSRYPIDSPSEEQIRLLSFVHREQPVKKSAAVEYAENESLPCFDGLDSDATPQAKYRRLDTHVLDELVEQGYITTESRGRNTLLELTQDGENTLLAFEYLI